MVLARVAMVEAAWLWLKHQPDSALSHWFHVLNNFRRYACSQNSESRAQAFYPFSSCFKSIEECEYWTSEGRNNHRSVCS
jgi:hypothetical protein